MFLFKYQTKQSPYDLRNKLLTKPRSRTTYGDQKLSSKIPDILNEHPVVLDMLISETRPLKFKKSIKNLLFSVD